MEKISKQNRQNNPQVTCAAHWKPVAGGSFKTCWLRKKFSYLHCQKKQFLPHLKNNNKKNEVTISHFNHREQENYCNNSKDNHEYSFQN